MPLRGKKFKVTPSPRATLGSQKYPDWGLVFFTVCKIAATCDERLPCEGELSAQLTEGFFSHRLYAIL